MTRDDAKARGIKVCGLDWSKVDGHVQDGRTGMVYLERAVTKWTAYFTLKDGHVFRFKIGMNNAYENGEAYPSEEAAKAAAQADYETRILEAIE